MLLIESSGLIRGTLVWVSFFVPTVSAILLFAADCELGLLLINHIIPAIANKKQAAAAILIRSGEKIVLSLFFCFCSLNSCLTPKSVRGRVSFFAFHSL